MNILFAASEAVPFIKTGGLADVIGSLPKELAEQGVEVSVVLPKYADIKEQWTSQLETVAVCTVPVGWRNQYCGIQRLTKDGITYYLIDNELYFKRSGLYGYGDDAERFSYFNRAVLEMLPVLGLKPDVIHCHDWQAALIPVFLKSHYAGSEFHQSIRTVLTIHNLRYHGNFAPEIIGDKLGLGSEWMHWDGLELNGGASFLKGGLNCADKITTVSRTYAEEIQMPYYGESLDGLLRRRSDDLTGIVNGIDYAEFDPMTDPHLALNFRDSYAKKQKNKTALQEEIGLNIDKDATVIALVTRLVEQKGLDLITRVMDDIMEDPQVQFVVLGTGDYKYERFFWDKHDQYPDRVSAQIRFDEGLARRIYASSDLFLMPSQFEPCGIGQLIALRYRSIPIVRETGGLKDTVQPYIEETGEGTGFSFTNYNAHDMLYTIRRAVRLTRDETVRDQLFKNIKKADFSWAGSAKQYVSLYASLAVGQE